MIENTSLQYLKINYVGINLTNDFVSADGENYKPILKNKNSESLL